MRRRLLVSAGALAILGGFALLVATDYHRSSGPPPSTIGVNALPMSPDPATYRLRLDGKVSRAHAAPADATRVVAESPGGGRRVEIGKTGVVLVDARTGTRRVLTQTSYPNGAFWSSRGTLAYADRKDGMTRVITVDPASGRERAVASHVCGDAFHVNPWSPDGRALAFGVSPVGGGCNGNGGSEVAVWISGRLRRVGPLPSSLATWSADGRQLLVSARDGMLLVDLRSGETRKVLPGVGFADGAWSSGRRAFAAYGTDSANRESVFLVDGGLRRIVRSVVWGTRFAWSPRAQLLAVSDGRRVRVIDGQTGKDVATIPAQTPVYLLVESLAWSRDGHSILLVASPHPGHD